MIESRLALVTYDIQKSIQVSKVVERGLIILVGNDCEDVHALRRSTRIRQNQRHRR